MKTITEVKENEIIIKNSRFITIILPINSNSNIQEIINKIKVSYPTANHYCYAYLTEDYQKSSDDGEPSGTAGLPMLNILIKENLINILAITIRYFGGIKLGTGGLVRAYSKSVKEVIKKTNLINVIKGYKIKINIMYSDQKNLNYLLKDYQIINKDYQENITYEVLIPKDKLNILTNYNYEIINEEYIKNTQ